MTRRGRQTVPTTRWVIRLRWILLACGIATLATLFPGPTAARAGPLPVDGPAGIGVRLLDVNAPTAEDPRAGLYVIDHLAPGSVIERHIEVSNTTAAPAAIRLYAAGASITDGTFVGSPGGSSNELSTWNRVRPEALDLDPGSRATVTVTITVPGDAAPGERYAVVWAEVGSDPALSGGVQQVNRVGIRQYLSVGPGGPPAADFSIGSLTAARAADGAPVVLASVDNTGGRALDLAGELELLDGPGGLRAGPFPASLGASLGIGDREQVLILLDGQVPDGPWDATITLRSGLVERTARATLTFPDVGSATPVPVTPVEDRWPLGIIVGLTLVLLVVALLWAIRRHRNREAKLERRLAAARLEGANEPPPPDGQALPAGGTSAGVPRS